MSGPASITLSNGAVVKVGEPSNATAKRRRELGRLIAAAPELLEALRMFEARVLRHGSWDDGCFYYGATSASELQEPLALARSAIAKAEGRT